jgi:DnaJ-class molecular chaperone
MDCQRCEGSGVVETDLPLFGESHLEACPECHGYGFMFEPTENWAEEMEEGHVEG